MERIVRQVKMLKIYAPVYYDHAYVSRSLGEEVYYIGKFISEEDTQTRFELAKKERDIDEGRRWAALVGQVKTDTWWENVEIL